MKYRVLFLGLISILAHCSLCKGQSAVNEVESVRKQAIEAIDRVSNITALSIRGTCENDVGKAEEVNF
jgi:hypothetical protein